MIFINNLTARQKPGKLNTAMMLYGLRRSIMMYNTANITLIAYNCWFNNRTVTYCFDVEPDADIKKLSVIIATGQFKAMTAKRFEALLNVVKILTTDINK
jgi:hypothetical protein